MTAGEVHGHLPADGVCRFLEQVGLLGFSHLRPSALPSPLSRFVSGHLLPLSRPSSILPNSTLPRSPELRAPTGGSFLLVGREVQVPSGETCLIRIEPCLFSPSSSAWSSARPLAPPHLPAVTSSTGLPILGRLTFLFNARHDPFESWVTRP